MSKVIFRSLYANDLDSQKARYAKTSESFEALFSAKPERFFSASGRTEVCGNHTDHNHGKVVAAAVNLDIIAAVCPTENGVVTVKSEGFDKIDIVDSSDISIKDEENDHSAALIRGVVAGFIKRGYNVGGFNAYTTSSVLKGSGLSSSAAFEVLIGTVLNHLYNEDKVSPVEIAQIAQYAENVYFGKPSGLMDQMASSVGGFITIDFADTEKPVIEAMDFDPAKAGYHLCIVDTKGSHSELTPEYAAIPTEMKAVAGFFSKPWLREITKADVLANIAAVREKCGDRAVLRALHFFDENDRVDTLCKAIRSGDFDGFLAVINASGDSSYKYLQNVFAASIPHEQSVSIALNVCQSVLKGKGAHRVHGGGFAGTIQAFVPDEALDEFKSAICAVFGDDSCHVLSIRPVGGTEVILD